MNNREGNGTPLQYFCRENPVDRGAWWAEVHGVTRSRTRLSDFPFTFHFPALEKEMATHSSVLAWRIPGTGEPGRLPSMGSHRVRHDWSDLAAAAAAAVKLLKPNPELSLLSSQQHPYPHPHQHLHPHLVGPATSGTKTKYLCDAIYCLVAKLCLTLPGSSVDRIFQARILAWVPFPSLGDLPDAGIKLASPAL